MEINKRLLGILVIISLTGSGWFINDIFGNDYRGKFMDKKTIALVPIGSIDRELLKKLAGSLGEVFSLPVSIEPPLKQPSYAYSAKRQQ